MANVTQRSFGGGEIAPALHARADLSRYAIGLRTCRNMVVMRAGGATKRPGTKLVNTVGVSVAYHLTLTPAVTLAAPLTTTITATLTDTLGNVVTAFPCTFETDSGAIATVASTGPRTALVAGVGGGVTNIRARIVALGLVSNDCLVTISDFYVLHAFVGDGALTVTTGAASGFDRLIIGGAGSGGSVDGSGVGAGGGGAGELIAETNIAVAPGVYPAVIGGGGVAPGADHTIGGGVFGSLPGNPGTDTTFMGRRARGGGYGGLAGGGGPGGSGGGSGSWGGAGVPLPGGASTAVAPGVGSAGGTGVNFPATPGAGGGGAGGGGALGAGGAGVSSSITGAPFTFARGGGAVSGAHGANGAPNTGNGGQGGGPGLGNDGGNGGSGVVYVRYKASTGIVATGGIKTTYPL